VIKKTTLNGESVVAAYLDRRLRPVTTEDEAEIIKVLVGERVVWLSPRTNNEIIDKDKEIA
jgi:hypothetical protein